VSNPPLNSRDFVLSLKITELWAFLRAAGGDPRVVDDEADPKPQG